MALNLACQDMGGIKIRNVFLNQFWGEDGLVNASLNENSATRGQSPAYLFAFQQGGC